MKPIRTTRFKRQFNKTPQRQQNAFAKQLRFLLEDPHHPSLNTKIVDEERRIWQARVDKSWRFYFQMWEDKCYLLDIVKHPK